MQSKYFFHSKWISPALICTHHFRISQNSCETADLSYVWISLLEMKWLFETVIVLRRKRDILLYKHMQVHSKESLLIPKRLCHPRKRFFQWLLCYISTPDSHVWHRSWERRWMEWYLWDTGKVHSSQAAYIPEREIPLATSLFLETRQTMTINAFNLIDYPLKSYKNKYIPPLCDYIWGTIKITAGIFSSVSVPETPCSFSN